MPPRKLRVKGQLFELPEGFEAFNPDIYQKKFGHRLAKAAAAQQQGAAAAAAAAQQPAGDS